MLKLRPHRQVSLRGPQEYTGKLAKRFYGPFSILERIGPVAYRLQLPTGTRVHPVFHCSLLKPFKGTPPSDITAVQLPEKFFGTQPIITPLAILDHRQTSQDPPRWEVLVQWQGLPPDDTSWEDWSTLCRDYHLEDKVLLQGPWSVSKVADTKPSARESSGNNAEVQIEKREKRKITKPAYLQDYV